MLTYLHLDVFTDQLFAGNQLAVSLDPPHDLPQAVMQAIAREMAFSETTFVFPPDVPGTDWRVRIFTPASELPMARPPHDRHRLRARACRPPRARAGLAPSSPKGSGPFRSISSGRARTSRSRG